MTWESHYDEHIGFGRLAVDVGAHLGEHTGKMAKRYDKVVAFEPQAKVRNLLGHIVPKNVEIRPEVVWDICGVVKFWNHDQTMLSGVHQVNPMKKTRGTPTRAQAITLDSLNLQDLDLLKVDTEGAEIQVINGAHETIMRCKPVLLLEIHSKTAGDRILEYLKKFHYDALTFPSRLHTLEVHWIVGYPLNRKES